GLRRVAGLAGRRIAARPAVRWRPGRLRFARLRRARSARFWPAGAAGIRPAGTAGIRPAGVWAAQPGQLRLAGLRLARLRVTGSWLARQLRLAGLRVARRLRFARLWLAG